MIVHAKCDKLQLFTFTKQILYLEYNLQPVVTRFARIVDYDDCDDDDWREWALIVVHYPADWYQNVYSIGFDGILEKLQ